MDGEQPADEEQMVYDQKRAAMLDKIGIKVMHYWDHNVFQNTDDVVEDLLRELEER